MSDNRPKWLNDLIADFGRMIGFDDLDLTDDDSFQLEIEGIPITVMHPPAGDALILRSPVPLQAAPPVDTLALLHGANIDSLSQGMGIIACDLALGSWVWADRVPLAGLTTDELLTRIEAAANAARFWRNEAARLAAKATGTTDDTPPSPGDILFRL